MCRNPTDEHGDPTTFMSPTAIVHREYDVLDPPPVPSPQWTRFVCVSDTHANAFPVPPGDVLLHAGDLTDRGNLSEFRSMVDWLRGLPHAVKIIIAGNHDLSLDQHDDWYNKNFHRWRRAERQDVGQIRDLLLGAETRDTGLVYLEDGKYEFQARKDGKLWSVYGSPWTPFFGGWAFNYNRGLEAEGIISKFPKTDILLTHGPPADILDKTILGEAVGCEALSAALPALRPRLHVFGHIHESHGAEIHEWPCNPSLSGISVDSTDRTVFVNAANSPLGPMARTQGSAKLDVGTGPFKPIIVDLLDVVPHG